MGYVYVIVTIALLPFTIPAVIDASRKGTKK